MSADQTLDEARMSQAIEATIGAIPRRRSNTSERSRGSPVWTKRRSSALMISSGVPTPTKPDEATVSPERMMATASAASTILLRISLHSQDWRRGQAASRRCSD